MANMQSTNESTALRLATCLQDHVVTYPQLSEDEPGGYCGEVDRVMDEAAAELLRLHAENTTLQQGYDAARLEIEVLRSRQCLHGISEPSGWMPIATAPVAGLILLAVEDSAGERRVFAAEASHENGGWVWNVTLGWLGWTRLHSGWTPILWRRLPLPPSPSGVDEGGSNG